MLDPAFLRKLEMLSLATRRAPSNIFSGEHAGARHGHSIEFADYRNYSLGDDFRHIDWNAYGRLEKLFLKMFREETELSVYLLVDASASMDAVPDKFRYAREVAAALGYIALCNCDRLVSLALDGEVRPGGPALRGKARAPRLFAFLEALEATGAGRLDRALQAFVHARQRPGLVLVVSDFLQEGEVFEGLKALRRARHDVFAVQVLGAAELHPALAGDLRLVDAESGQAQDVTMTGRLLEAYRQTLQAYLDELQAHCAQYGIGHALASTERPLQELVLEALRRESLVR